MEMEMDEHGFAIRQGGHLAFTPDGAAGSRRTKDVTNRADSFLFEPCRLDTGVTLADVLSIVRDHEVLQRIFHRDWAKELVEEAFAGEWQPARVEYAPDAIEYLEIHQQWHFDSRRRVYHAGPPPELHGVGFKLRDDYNDESGNRLGEKGSRIRWAVDLSSPRGMMNLPLTINPEVEIVEDDPESNRFGQTIQTVYYERLNLCQILHAVVWELGWHGPPERRDARRDEIMRLRQQALRKAVAS
jgi:hypothetical protein